MYLLSEEIPVTFLYDVRVSFLVIVARICAVAHFLSDDEREALFVSLGDGAGAAAFDCITQDHPRALFVSRIRGAIRYMNTATADLAGNHAATLKAARLMVVKLTLADDATDDANLPGFYVPKGWVNGRFYSTLSGASRYSTLSGALAAARSRLQDHADRFFPTRTNTSRFRMNVRSADRISA